MTPAVTLPSQPRNITSPAYMDVPAGDYLQTWHDDVTSALPTLTRFWYSCLHLPTLEAVNGECIKFMHSQRPDQLPRELLVAFDEDLRREDASEDVSSVTAELFGRLVDDISDTLPSSRFLEQVARRYLDSTAYLQPVLHDYSSAALAMSDQGGISNLALFLRDAVWYWPSLQALRESHTALDLVVFTRPLRHAGAAPLVFTEGQPGDVQLQASGDMSGRLLLDVGLYGTLVADLAASRFTDNQTAVFFLGSQNPNLFGFLNRRARYLHSEEAATLDVVRYVDSVECLLKPVHLHSDADRGVQVQLASPISFICATAFMWRQYRYSMKRRVEARSASTHLLPVPNARSWLLPNEIPVWDKASEFVGDWSVDNIAPVDKVNGWFDQWVGA